MIKAEAPQPEDLRYKAAVEFAQTMVVVDDEASQTQSVTPTPVSKPVRSVIEKSVADDDRTRNTEETEPIGYPLDAKSLIDNAMDLGIICSVLRPRKEDEFQARVVTAAKSADIVCLDWDIYNDDGKATSEIISNIIEKDSKQNGRIRLIAIYTGDTSNTEILDNVFTGISESLRDGYEFNEQRLEGECNTGARLVCLFKSNGTRLDMALSQSANQVGENELPKRLQEEFAKLSQGLLSNIALATIASIRSSTHHVLFKFTGQMDGPYFHHRALIVNPGDAEEYAVDVILSEIKGAIAKQCISDTYGGPKAIEARIREMANDCQKPTLHYKKNGISNTYKLAVEDSVKIVTDGLKTTIGNLPNSPSESVFKKYLSSMFTDSWEPANLSMLQFAALTGIRAFPGNYLYRSANLYPQLGLGTIIQDENDGTNELFLLCLQASCDSVSIKESGKFLFVQLVENQDNPEHIIPIHRDSNRVEYIGFATPKESYRALRVIEFNASPETQTVNAEKIDNGAVYYFKDTNSASYRWIADMKRRRALRATQRLGQKMGRLGFTEFEPYRRSLKD